jgi:hypothetical protein
MLRSPSCRPGDSGGSMTAGVFHTSDPVPLHAGVAHENRRARFTLTMSVELASLVGHPPRWPTVFGVPAATPETKAGCQSTVAHRPSASECRAASAADHQQDERNGDRERVKMGHW